MAVSAADAPAVAIKLPEEPARGITLQPNTSQHTTPTAKQAAMAAMRFSGSRMGLRGFLPAAEKPRLAASCAGAPSCMASSRAFKSSEA